MRRLPLVSLAVCAAAVLACSAVSQQKAVAPAPDNSGFHNLQVLPQTITHDELIATMRGFTRGLGVRCDHCHVHTPGGGERDFDFASDAKPEKNVARAMLRMTRTVNADYLAKVNAHGQTVTCMTCHRGHSVPELPAPEAPHPGGEAPQHPAGEAPAPPHH